MPAGVYRVLPPAGLRLSLRGGSGACRQVPRDDAGPIRAEICIPDSQPHAPPRAIRLALPLLARWGLQYPSSQAYSVQDFPVLAGVGEESTRMGEDREILSRNR